MNNIFKKAYWHIFKTMPCEMILKRQWDEYRRINKKYALRDFDLSCIEPSMEKKEEREYIFFFWDKGLENAPAIVKQCYGQLISKCPKGWEVILLTKNTASQYIKLPAFIETLFTEGKIWRALYADLLRLALLYKYGGIWCDATCYLTQSIPTEILESELFFFEFASLLPHSPMKYENWFIRAKKENYVIGRILQSLLYYWSQPKKKQDYFVWFYIQTALYLQDKEAKLQMDNMWYCCNYDAMLVQIHYGLTTVYTDKLWKQISEKCFVQKLSHKITPQQEKNLLHYLLPSHSL